MPDLLIGLFLCADFQVAAPGMTADSKVSETVRVSGTVIPTTTCAMPGQRPRDH
jgi:hypothetical protein